MSAPETVDPTVIVRSLAELERTFAMALLRAVSRANRECAGKFPGFVRWELYETYRAQERQNWLYEQGRTRPGRKVTWTRNSAHTQREAADVVWRDTAGRWHWDGPPALWDRLGHCVRAHGLCWGGDWARPDPYHVQSWS